MITELQHLELSWIQALQSALRCSFLDKFFDGHFGLQLATLILRYALIQAKQLTFNLGEDYDNLAALLCQVSASLR